MAFSSDPFESMNRMFEQMRRGSFASPFAAPFEGAWTAGDMNLSLEPTDEGYLVMADLPGFEKDEITVRFEDDVLSITAVHEATDESAVGSRRRSRRVHDEVRVPASVIEAEISATYRNGVLEILLPTEEDVTDDDEHVIEIN